MYTSEDASRDIEATGATGIERAKIAAKALNAEGKSVYIQWSSQGVPSCPLCFQRIDKKGNCPCGVNKKPDPSIKKYIQCCNSTVKGFREEAERARKRHEEKKRKEAEQAEKAGGGNG